MFNSFWRSCYYYIGGITNRLASVIEYIYLHYEVSFRSQAWHGLVRLFSLCKPIQFFFYNFLALTGS